MREPIKTVKLTDQQFVTLRRYRIDEQSIAEMLAKFTLELMEKHNEAQQKLWDQLAAILGYKNEREASQHGKLEIHWLSEEVRLLPHDTDNEAMEGGV